MGTGDQSGRNEVQIAVMANEMKQMKDDIAQIKADIRKFIEGVEANFVTQQEFAPYRRAMQIISGVVITALAAAILSLVLKK